MKDDDQLATAAVLAHGVLSSLSLVMYAFNALERAVDRSAWAAELNELVDSVPIRIDLAAEHLRLIAMGAPGLVDVLDELGMHTASR